MDFLDSLRWRYATKIFDSSRKLSEEDVAYLKEVIRLTPSSYGLQLYKVIIIKDKSLKEKLKEASWNQSQLTDASHLFLFCSYTTLEKEHIDDYIQRKATLQDRHIEELQSYGNHIYSSLRQKSEEQKLRWSISQTYIALGQLLVGCATRRIDACPMEGFDPKKYSRILDLSSKGLYPSVLAAVGYRSEQDKTQYDKKVRKQNSELFEKI